MVAPRERLIHLFLAVLGLSAVSWGGLALMAQLERRYVQRKALLTPEAYADLVAVAWTVPGPVAGNVAVQLGYVLAGAAGAWVAGLASVLPFLLLMTGFAFAYQQYGASVAGMSVLATRFSLILACLIALTYFRQARALLATKCTLTISLVSTILLWHFHAPVVFLGVLAGSFSAGWVLAPDKTAGRCAPCPSTAESGLLVAMCVAILLFALLPVGQPLWLETIRQAGAGLTLFGGGFSAIPVLKGFYLEGTHHIGSEAFAAALALTSISPGPLLNIIPFLGGVQHGPVGSLLATAAVFVPTGVLAVLVLRWRDALRSSARFEHALVFLRAATTAFLAETVLRLVPHVPPTLPNVLIALVVLIALWRWKAPAYVLYFAVAAVSIFV